MVVLLISTTITAIAALVYCYAKSKGELPCQHDWTKWMDITMVYQARKCKKCGKQEIS